MAKLSKKTILVVDDDESVRTLLREILGGAGFDIAEAVDGDAALALLEKTPVDLLITDRSMPGVSGLDLLRKLREKKIMVPALMISAYGEVSLWGQAIGLGAVDYLTKPFKASDVLLLVNKILNGPSNP